MPIAKREPDSASADSCPDCRHGDKSMEAGRSRHEHYLRFGRVHGVARLRQHLIEQYGEERFNFSYAYIPSMVDRKLTVEEWMEEG